MALAELPTAILIRPRASRWPSTVTEPAIVPLSGEHDASTRRALAQLLAGTIATTDGDVVLDLRLVSFLDASTLGVLAGAGAFLRSRGRTLVLRGPSAFGRRVIEMGGLGALLEATAPSETRRAS